jgi:hypothetical protein
MTKTKIAPANPVLLERDADGVTARYPTQTFRFMFHDGDTLDVTGAVRDDSHLREAVLALTGKERILGVANITEVLPPVPLPDQLELS